MYFASEGEGPQHRRALTEADKFAEFNAPVVVIGDPEPGFDRWVGLDTIDGKPTFLDIVYTPNDKSQRIHIRNVREYDPPPRVTFSNIARTTLTSYLLNINHFHRDGETDRRGQRARADEHFAHLRTQNPTPSRVSVDGVEVSTDLYETDGYTVHEAPASAGRLVIVGPADQLEACDLHTAGPQFD